MTDQAPQDVRSYLARLDAALVSVPADLARDVRSGIEEELSGLDAATASARMKELGDPAFIAAEVRDAASPAADQDPGADRPLAETRGFTITAGLIVAVGGMVVPLVGWIVGIVMVWMSPIWRRGEKWVATLVSPLVSVLTFLIGLVIAWVNEEAAATYPLMYGYLNFGHIALLAFPASAALVGLWLLWRARGRVVA